MMDNVKTKQTLSSKWLLLSAVAKYISLWAMTLGEGTPEKSEHRYSVKIIPTMYKHTLYLRCMDE